MIGFESLDDYGPNVQLIPVLCINGEIIISNYSYLLGNIIPKNIKQLYNTYVYPIGKKTIIIPQYTIGFYIIGKQLIFKNSKNVIDYNTNKSFNCCSKYFRIAIDIDGNIKEDDNNLNSDIFEYIHINKYKTKVVSIKLNQNLTYVDSIYS